MLTIAVVMSPGFNDVNALDQVLDKFLPCKLMVLGWSQSDAYVRHYAAKHNIECMDFSPDWKGEGEYAGYIRNDILVDICSFMIAIWDGRANVVKHAFEKARGKNKLHQVWQLNQNGTITLLEP